MFEEANERAIHFGWGQGDPGWERNSQPSPKALKFTQEKLKRDGIFMSSAIILGLNTYV